MQTIGIISIPSNLYGEHLKLNSVTLQSKDFLIQDDGLGNMLSGSEKVGDIIYEHGIIILTNDGIPPLPGNNNGYGFVTYGTAIYDTDDTTFISSFIDTSNITCSFESTTTIYDSQYKCTLLQNDFNFTLNEDNDLEFDITIKDPVYMHVSSADSVNEFNFTLNPTIISGSSLDSTLYDFATGSYFTPYVTTVGMYNNAKQLIAVGKLAQPLPISQVTDTSILVNLDL